MTTKKIIKLSKAINAHGDGINEIELSEPTGKQVVDIGLPYSMNSYGDISINMKLVGRYISALGNIPPSAVAQMNPSDLNDAAWVIAGFFMAEKKEEQEEPEETQKSESDSL